MYKTSQIVELVLLRYERDQLIRDWHSSDRSDLAMLLRLGYLGQRVQELECEE
jgi:hypothetical protein